MKVDVGQRERGFHYQIERGEDDLEQSGRRQEGNTGKRFTFAQREFEVRLPKTFTHIHPDLHASAILRVLLPMMGSRLDLSFEVSAQYASHIKDLTGITIERVSSSLSARQAPTDSERALFFSGGVDSLAAALLMPKNCPLILKDRLPHDGPHLALGVGGELDHGQALGKRLARDGHPFTSMQDSHERLWLPYPLWHSEMPSLAAFYLADSLSLDGVDAGATLGALHFCGYADDGRTDWAFKRLRDWEQDWSPAGRVEELAAQGGSRDTFHQNPTYELALAGLRYGMPTLGLSEVATAYVVFNSPYRGQASSCYFDDGSNYCLRCDKCFKKILLDYIFRNRKVPAGLFDQFLKQPHLADIFRRPYFDWHHIWYYIFQRLRCDHPFATELSKAARAGPDLSLLEKWYPNTRFSIASEWRADAEEAINGHLLTMTPQEVTMLEGLDVPPLPVLADLLDLGRPRLTPVSCLLDPPDTGSTADDPTDPARDEPGEAVSTEPVSQPSPFSSAVAKRCMTLLAEHAADFTITAQSAERLIISSPTTEQDWFCDIVSPTQGSREPAFLCGSALLVPDRHLLASQAGVDCLDQIATAVLAQKSGPQAAGSSPDETAGFLSYLWAALDRLLLPRAGRLGAVIHGRIGEGEVDLVFRTSEKRRLQLRFRTRDDKPSLPLGPADIILDVESESSQETLTGVEARIVRGYRTRLQPPPSVDG